jgi:hypothetical protein
MMTRRARKTRIAAIGLVLERNWTEHGSTPRNRCYIGSAVPAPAPLPLASTQGDFRTIRGIPLTLAIWPAMTIALVLYAIHVVAPLRLAIPVLLPALATLPVGVLAARSALGPQARGFAWLIGPTWGYALTALVALGLWSAGARGAWMLVAAPLIALAPAWGFRAFRSPIVRSTFAHPAFALPSFGRRDVIALSIALMLVPAVCGRPFAHVGERTPEGEERWRAYFTADMVWSMAVAAEVAKGEMPPRNMFRNGEALHYYWLAHLIPAIEHRALKTVDLRQILLINALLSALAFVAFLYAFVRCFLASTAIACGATIAAVLCHSFEGVQQLASLWFAGAPLDLVRYTNIDGVTRWTLHGMPIDGLQRLLLYQPQHQLGYAIGWSALIVIMAATDALRPRIAALAGTLLAMSFLISTFSGLMLTAAACVALGLAVVRRRAWRPALACAVAAGVPLALALVLSEALRYVEHGGALVTVGLNHVALVHWPEVVFLNFGASLIGAAAALVFAWRAGVLPRFEMLWIAIGTAWFFYFMVDVRDHQDVYVGWRAGHMLFIAFAPLTGYAWQRLRDSPRPLRIAGLLAGLCVTAASLPTTVIDLYNTQDTNNFIQGPGYHWTLQLSPGEVEALTWIRTWTPAAAIVQVEPFLRDRETWAYVPAFAERRMAAGLPISMIPLANYERASERVRDVFAASTAPAVYDLAQRLLIDYLVIAPPERAQYPALEATLDTAPKLFRRVFHNGAVSVYEVQDR